MNEISDNNIKEFYNFFRYFTILILLIFNFNLSLIAYNHIDDYDSTKLNNKNNINHTIRIINKFIIICRKRKLINKKLYSSSQPKITAVIILYNSEKTIKTSIRSVQNQNISDIEIILVDDFSSDESLKIISNIAEKDSRIIYYGT